MPKVLREKSPFYNLSYFIILFKSISANTEISNHPRLLIIICLMGKFAREKQITTTNPQVSSFPTSALSTSADRPTTLNDLELKELIIPNWLRLVDISRSAHKSNVNITFIDVISIKGFSLLAAFPGPCGKLSIHLRSKWCFFPRNFQ